MKHKINNDDIVMKQIKFSPIPQFIVLLLFFLLLSYSTQVNQYLDEQLINYPDNTKLFIKITLFIIPLIFIIVFDMIYHSFSINNLGISKIIPNEYINYTLKLIGIYGIVQVLSQDMGIKSGKLQAEITRTPFVHFIMMWGAGFALSGQRSESFIGALLYVFLRNLLSNKETVPSCFEETD